MPTSPNSTDPPSQTPNPREPSAPADLGLAPRRLIPAAQNSYLPPWKQQALQDAVDAVERAATRVPNYPPALKPVAVAQFLLESNWGRSGMGDAHNYFGIKARAGEPFVTRKTWEHINGADIQVDAQFRRFASLDECFAAHAALFFRTRSGRQIYGKALNHPRDPVAFAHALTGVYATDPKYGAKLERIIRDRGLLATFGFAD